METRADGTLFLAGLLTSNDRRLDRPQAGIGIHKGHGGVPELGDGIQVSPELGPDKGVHLDVRDVGHKSDNGESRGLNPNTQEPLGPMENPKMPTGQKELLRATRGLGARVLSHRSTPSPSCPHPDETT